MNKKIKKTIGILLIIFLTLAAILLIYTSIYYKADLDGYQINRENFIDDGVYLAKGDQGLREALVFYPGAKVEYTAYVPLVDSIAEKTGLDIFLTKMPFNLAILDSDRALDIIESYDYNAWYIGGHSMGGAFASNYASKASGLFEGLILLGAYPYGDYLNEDTLSIYGSLENQATKEKNNHLIYKYEIPGANHAQFGNYGDQKGDAKAQISREDHQKKTVEIIKQWLEERK